ncbi:pheromone A receptor-domain-containing protein [Mycena metata]|uniref:Pheromone A receptor-domain-containing protein n=1 Tax=Mycena metata TaxID=1033252 RepID=A0AAD7N8G6_9AGAR|nr:pheromone A receptor-domain-containing protein [Mycena metata]
MLVVLPVLSFICAGLLAVFLIILIRRLTVNTSNVAIVLWLLLGNAVHAVNTIVWSSNNEPRISVWCDIVTKLLLGTTVALPGVCLCSARYLELLSSDRKIYPHTYSKRFHTLLDVALCYVLPLLYMILHFAVQDHRFDLVQNFGCSASIHRSTPAVLIMIIPPLILCSISLVLCLLTVWNYARLSSERFTSHLSARSNSISVPLFTRRVAKSILLTATVLIVTLFPLLGPRNQSWAQFHPNYSQILFVREPAEVGAVQTVWWSIPVVSIVYLVLTLVLGETTDTFSWVRRRCPALFPRGRPVRPELSRLTFANSQHEMVSKSSSPLTAPQPVQLRSGWDEMLDIGTKGRRAFLLNPNASRKSVVSSATDSDGDYSPSSSPTLKDDLEDAFTSSTLWYLASPVAQALGLPSPVASSTFASLKLEQSRSRSGSPNGMSVVGSSAMPSPSPIVRTPAPTPAPALRILIPTTPVIPPAPTSAPPPQPKPTPTPTLPLHVLVPPRQPIPEDTVSTISSIWDAPWPLPPATPTPTLRSPARSPTVSRSPTSSSRTATRTAASSPVSSIVNAYAPAAPTPIHIQSPRRAQSVPRKPVVPVRNVRRTWSRETLARGYAGTDVIYMTQATAV